MEGPLNGGLILLDGGSIGQVWLGLPKRKNPECNTLNSTVIFRIESCPP